MFHFYYTLWKRQKANGFLTFSGGTEIEHWVKMGEITNHEQFYIAADKYKSVIKKKTLNIKLKLEEIRIILIDVVFIDVHVHSTD